MTFWDLADTCLTMVEDFEKNGSFTIDLLKKVYDGPFDPDSIATFIRKTDEKTKASLDDIIDKTFMDERDIPMNREQALMFRLRLEYATFMLLRIYRQKYLIDKIPCLGSDRAGLAFALISLWEAGSILWPARASQVFCAGHKSSLDRY